MPVYCGGGGGGMNVKGGDYIISVTTSALRSPIHLLVRVVWNNNLKAF